MMDKGILPSELNPKKLEMTSSLINMNVSSSFLLKKGAIKINKLFSYNQEDFLLPIDVFSNIYLFRFL